jgi:hypothetical protein
MKTLILLAACCLAAGCKPMSPHQLVRELKNDPAIIVAKVVSIYGTASLTRIGVTTNNVTITPDGTITINK